MNLLANVREALEETERRAHRWAEMRADLARRQHIIDMWSADNLPNSVNPSVALQDCADTKRLLNLLADPRNSSWATQEIVDRATAILARGYGIEVPG